MPASTLTTQSIDGSDTKDGSSSIVESLSNTHENRDYHFHVDHVGNVTTLLIKFDASCGLQRHFSSVKIVLYCDASWVDARHTWAIRQLDHTSKDHTPHSSPKYITLPQLTIAFKIFPRVDGTFQYDHIPVSSLDGLRHLNHDSVYTLLESKYFLTPDTQSVSVAVTRTVRLTPVGRPRQMTTSIFLPMELLLKIFENIDSCECEWQHNLLLFAQVCRKWSQCALKVLFARLEDMEWKRSRFLEPDQSLDPWEFAMALSKIPALGLGVQHLDINQHKGTPKCQHHSPPKKSLELIPALIAILCATTNLQHLHLSLLYTSPWLANARFLALPELPHLQTLSITSTSCIDQPTTHSPHSINKVQLAYCMSRWPALTSLMVEDVKPGNIGIWRFSMRPPMCALTQLCVRKSGLSDKDLLYLTASSAKTLTHVTLHHLWGVTDDGLYDFLEAISQNVRSLTIWNVWSVMIATLRKEVTSLDTMVDKMPCLHALNICGDIATEYMLRRRSEMFAMNCGLGVPMVRLSFKLVPRIRPYANQEWAGWELIDVSC